MAVPHHRFIDSGSCGRQNEKGAGQGTAIHSQRIGLLIRSLEPPHSLRHFLLHFFYVCYSLRSHCQDPAAKFP